MSALSVATCGRKLATILAADVVARALCLPNTISGSIDDEVRRESVVRLCGRSDERDGYAWSPNVGPNLLAAFKESFLEVLKHPADPGGHSENLVAQLATICLEAPQASGLE